MVAPAWARIQNLSTRVDRKLGRAVRFARSTRSVDRPLKEEEYSMRFGLFVRFVFDKETEGEGNLCNKIGHRSLTGGPTTS